MIDGVAVADPASETFYGMGRMASGIEIPFTGGGYYAEKDVPHGDIRIKKYFSTVTNSWRQFYIYTPPGYDSNINDKISCAIYTCMAAEKMKEDGQRREKQI